MVYTPAVFALFGKDVLDVFTQKPLATLLFMKDLHPAVYEGPSSPRLLLHTSMTGRAEHGRRIDQQLLSYLRARSTPY